MEKLPQFFSHLLESMIEIRRRGFVFEAVNGINSARFSFWIMTPERSLKNLRRSVAVCFRTVIKRGASNVLTLRWGKTMQGREYICKSGDNMSLTDVRGC